MESTDIQEVSLNCITTSRIKTDIEIKTILSDLKEECQRMKDELDDLERDFIWLQVFLQPRKFVSIKSPFEDVSYFSEIPRCIFPIDYDLRKNSQKQKENDVQSEDIEEVQENPDLQERSNLFDEITKPLLMSLESIQESVKSQLMKIPSKKVPLSKIVKDFTSIEDLRILVGLLYLHHSREISLKFDDKKWRWEVYKNGL